MTLENLIHTVDRLTPVEAELGYYLMKNKEIVSDMSIMQLAEATSISKSAIHRFCKRIGVKGFNELKVVIVRDLAQQRENMEYIDVNYPFRKEDGPQLIANKLLKLYEQAIYDTYDYIDPIQLQKVAYLIYQAKNIDFYTHAHNMNIAKNFKDKMITIGRMVNCPSSFYEQRSTVLASTPETVAVVLSYSGKATFIKPVIQKLYEKKIPVVLIGKQGSNYYPQYVTYAISISGKEHYRDRISQFSSHIAMQYMLDVIFGCIYNLNREKNIAYLKNVIHFMDDREIEEE